ncbi:MAG: hypothetical protein IJZ54_05375 [Clostridia bacterium]|nr:hypothetical protein [Clostridia bacterium]
MRISRAQIEGYEFTVKKGKYYEGKGVDAALDEIADGVEELLDELSEKNRRIRELENREKDVTEALLMVKKLSEEIIERSKNEAEKAVMEKAAEVLTLKEEIAELKTLRDNYKKELLEEISLISAKTSKAVENIGE